MKTELPKLTQEPLLLVDCTPDKYYPIRILQAHWRNCQCMWADNTGGEETENPLLVLMNDHNRKRAEFLNEAIGILEEHQDGR